MTLDPNISPEEPLPEIENVPADDPPLSEEEFPTKEDIEESERSAD